MYQFEYNLEKTQKLKLLYLHTWIKYCRAFPQFPLCRIRIYIQINIISMYNNLSIQFLIFQFATENFYIQIFYYV